MKKQVGHSKQIKSLQPSKGKKLDRKKYTITKGDVGKVYKVYFSDDDSFLWIEKITKILYPQGYRYVAYDESHRYYETSPRTGTYRYYVPMSKLEQVVVFGKLL